MAWIGQKLKSFFAARKAFAVFVFFCTWALLPILGYIIGLLVIDEGCVDKSPPGGSCHGPFMLTFSLVVSGLMLGPIVGAIAAWVSFILPREIEP